MEFISGTKQYKQFLQANGKLYEGIELYTKNTRSSAEHRDHQANTLDHDGASEGYLGGGGGYAKSSVFAGCHIFAPAGHIERYMEDAIFRFHETKKDGPIMAATNLLGHIINTHPFEDGNGRTSRLILAHVLMQMKFCLFQ